jgi:histone-lysine N-methyltransferase EZH2
MAKLFEVETQTPNFTPPKVSYRKLGDSIVRPCGAQCFLRPAINSTSIALATVWIAKDTRMLFSILDYVPDASSCDLAKICRKPCREVHAQRAGYQSPFKQGEKGKNTTNSVHGNYRT